MPTSKLVGAVLAVACVGVVGAAVNSGIRWTALRGVERGSDEALKSVFNSNALLGNTRAVYLPGYGVVFSAEMDVAPESTPNPFRPSFTKDEIARIKETKRLRIAVLRDRMSRLLVNFADSVQVGDSEAVAMAVTLLYSKVEDTDAMPKQIVIWAPRGLLRSGNAPAIAANLKVQESF
ncbi:MAG: hypothetical protein SGI92_11860 [Bryobacteraceae bacterium]|nr:hypothetical protein [Bryobacteraceae bacterium]